MSILRSVLTAWLAVTMAMLAGCGGGGGAGGQGAQDATVPLVVALDLSASVPARDPDGRLVSTITATAKDGSNRALSGQPVTFGSSDSGVSIEGASQSTGVNGTAVATLVISDLTNRSVTVQATSGGITRTVALSVVDDTSVSPSGASLVALADAPSIGSDGGTTVTITALARDAENRVLADQQVEFGTTDTGAVLQDIVATTSASGVATAKLRIVDPKNRDVTVRVRAGTLESAVVVTVVGTTVTVSGPSSVASGGSAQFTIALRNAAGGVLSGRTVTIASAAGNALSAASVVTGPSGQATVTLTGSRVGADTLSVSALGATGSASLQVSGTQIAFTSPIANEEVPVATSQPVTVVFTLGGVPQSGQTVRFVTTRGQASPGSALTDGNGRASTTVRSDSAGSATLTAIAGSVSGSQNIEFVSRVPAKLTLQSSPAVVGVNLSSASSNSTQLIAVVRDAADNPVKGQTVAFTADFDPSNGRILPGTATTDSAGIASVAFVPGMNSSAPDQVRIRAATVPSGSSAPIETTTTLTVSSQAMTVRVGTGNTLQEVDTTINAMPWSAVVTDASGNPVAGALVQASLVATGYYKGFYFIPTDGVVLFWSQSIVDKCVSEDLNDGTGSGNLRLDAGEDRNGDGLLTPGNVGAVTVTSAQQRTDANGLATLRVVYPKDYGNWTEMRLRVTVTSLAGSEGTAQRTFVLPAIARDLEVIRGTPPGQPSPFGQLPGCDNPN